eukprot:6206521-Amphidinium_carterae.1
MRPPLPTRVLLALAVTAWTLDWRRSCLALLLGFQALLRPAELAMLRRQHLVLPCDLAGHEDTLVVCITQSKTMARTSRLQSVLVSDPVVVDLANTLLAEDAASAPERLHIKNSPFTLGTLRGGGAVHHIQQCQSIALLQWKGRWTTERSVQHYLQVGLAATALAAISPHAKQLIDALAALAPGLLHPEHNGLRPTQPPTSRSQPHPVSAGNDMKLSTLCTAKGMDGSAREHSIHRRA